MNKYSEHIKNGLYIVILMVLLLPQLQSKFKIFSIAPLNGSSEKIENPYISKTTWLNGSYQEQQEIAAKRSYGFNEVMVRIYNQWNYTFFKKTNTQWVEIGKEGYLYETNYIKAALGLDFIGEDSIQMQVERLKVIADTLKKHQTDLVVVLAPGKGSFYPDYFPSQYNGVQPTTTNLEVFKKYFTKNGINYIDANSWFIDLKKTVHQKHKLYSKTGIHWSKYGEYLMADSLIKYLKATTQKPFPSIQLTKLEYSNQLRDTDNDVWKGLNIYSTIEDFKMTYPQWKAAHTEFNLAKTLVIGDSYYFGLFKDGLSTNYLNNGEFWYYCKEVYQNVNKTSQPLNLESIKKQALKNDVIIIMCTDATLPRFGFGFIENFK